MPHLRNRFFIRIILLTGLIFPILAACNFVPATETSDPNAIITYAAETIAVKQQQETFDAMQALLTSQALTLQAPSVTPNPTDTPVPTQTPLPTSTATMVSLPATPLPPPPTVTPFTLMLTADVDTRCRQGPSTAFATVSFILVGQQAELIGRNPEGTWWLIRDPQGRFGNCWVWGETTRPLGDASGVPVVQPPPPPTQPSTVNFQLSFVNLHICGGVAMATFQVTNTGSVAFFSSNITIRDVTNDVGLAGPEMSNAPFFTSAAACPPGFSSLPPGSSGFVMKGMGFLPPSGTRGRGIVSLCSQNNLNGQCVEQRVTFTFP